jgi:TonB family protein
VRPWAWALVGSLGLHALVMALVSSGFEAKATPPAPRAVARVGDAVFTRVGLARSPALVAPAPPAARQAVRACRGRACAPPEGARRLAAQPEAVSGPPPGPRPAAESEGDTEGAVGASAGGSAPDPDPPPAAQGEGGAGGPASADASAVDVVALVHARLAAVADGCYPAAARRFQQRGTVGLAFCADARGAPTGTSVTQSSGATLLDDAAKGCVLERAAPLPPEAASRCFTVPVRFGVR